MASYEFRRAPRRPAAKATAAAILLASVALPANADAPLAASTAIATSQATPAAERTQDIVVIAPPLFRDVQPERELDRTAIDSYGVSTVDELLSELQNEIGDIDEQPLILVNGERVNDIDEIGAYPVEALRNVQVLPRGSAVRAGGRSGQRVISLTLKRTLRSATITVAPKIATEGNWHAVRGEALLTHLHGATRANLALRVRDESSLLDSERGIIEPDARFPFALDGNVIAYPTFGDEIDPALTALAGHIVTVAPVAASGGSSLDAFLGAANETSFGQFRTLRPDTRSYDLNGTFATRLAPWLTGGASVRLTSTTDRSLRGLPTGLFLLPATNPFSPFGTNVGLAYYDRDPLHSRSRRDDGEVSTTFDARFGSWSSNFNLRYAASKDLTRSEGQSSFAFIRIDDATNPFAISPSELIAIRTNRASSRTHSTIAQLSATGPLVAMPAGALQATVEGRLEWESLHSESTFSSLSDRDIHQSEQTIRGAVEIPLTSRSNAFLPELGELSATAEVAATHSSYAGALHRHALGLTWDPRPLLRLRAAVERTDRAPPIEILGNPVIITPDARVFDPLTGETVDVVLTSGGNPGLKLESVKLRRVNALLRLVPRLNLQLNAEYTDTDRRDFVSGLPSASAAVMLAFPERYVRDADGVLTRVDVRPVNFDSHREKRLRWGFSMNTRVGGGAAAAGAAPPPSGEDGDAPAAPARTTNGKPTTYLQLTANHSMVLFDKILIRPDLDSVDLLRGGAIGIGGGRVRHQLDGTVALTSGGLGVRAGATWRGKSTLQSRFAGEVDELHFSPLFILNLRAFADARRILPHSAWAKGLRVSLNLFNITNERQQVRDSLGNTPIQFQPAYRDPIGRTVEIEVRKVF